MLPPDAVLGLFAKAPRPGQVKTRLAADSSPEWAARVAEAFLLDLVQREAGRGRRTIIYVAHTEKRDVTGRLATLLDASRSGAIKRPESMGAVVPGVGFEPTTFGL